MDDNNKEVLEQDISEAVQQNLDEYLTSTLNYGSLTTSSISNTHAGVNLNDLGDTSTNITWTAPSTGNTYPYGNNPGYGITNVPDIGTIGYPSTSGTYTLPSNDNAEVLERLAGIEKRLNILDKAPSDKIAALKDAYDHYKFIEKLCEGEESELGKESE